MEDLYLLPDDVNWRQPVWESELDQFDYARAHLIRTLRFSSSALQKAVPVVRCSGTPRSSISLERICDVASTFQGHRLPCLTVIFE